MRLIVQYHARCFGCLLGKTVFEKMLNNNISIINRTGYDTIIHSVVLGVEYNESRDRVLAEEEKNVLGQPIMPSSFYK